MQEDSNDLNSAWREATLKLNSIAQEYRAICQELEVTGESQHKRELRAWAATCVREFCKAIQQDLERRQKERLDRYH